jgi:hypothetical protein
MEDAVEHGGHRGHIAQQFSPVFDRPVGGEQRAGAFVAMHRAAERVAQPLTGVGIQQPDSMAVPLHVNATADPAPGYEITKLIWGFRSLSPK